MQNPTVSFVVPCYKLAHLLPECINSILAQTFGDFEVLIMDDHSPDNTREVAATFKDPRVKYIRNDPNLGALRNYNKGIQQASGKYVWLISADDYLRQPCVLQRYVDLLNANPNVGYVFCPGIGVKHGKETELLGYSTYGDRDRVVNGREFLQRLLDYNLVLAPSALARKECYEKTSYFPIDLVWAGKPVNLIWGGDWYLWCLFALHYDVGYFAEPMVAYREHDLAMTHIVTKGDVANCLAADVAVPWMIKHKADELNLPDVARKCLESLAVEYAKHLTEKEYRSSRSTVTLEHFEESLCRHTTDESERDWVRARVYAGMADSFYHRGDRPQARRLYRDGLQKDFWMAKVHAKRMLLSLGKPGDLLRKGLCS